MKTKKCRALLVLALPILSPVGLYSQTLNLNGQYFKIDTLYPQTSGNPGLNYPWEITYGPDDSLWVTEARGYKVYKIHPTTKQYRTVLSILGTVNFSEDGVNIWPQGGMEGLAIHPQFNSGKRYVYIAYVYQRTGTCPNNTSSPCYYKSQVVRYSYPATGPNRFTLCNPDTLITNLAGSNDHNSGRLAIGPDSKLYYTIGDMGAGQFNNSGRTNNAQDLSILEGKVLRLNLEPDAGQTGGDEWIPDDNPFPVGAPVTSKNAIYTYGHRNAQGLVWANVAGSWKLYSSEHGDMSDDEVNILESGKNYGWPRVSGLCDNNYTVNDGAAYTKNDKLAGMNVNDEMPFCTANNVEEPIFSFFPASKVTIQGFATSPSNIYTWWTIAPSSIDYYGAGPIPGWSNSLLVTSLKYGLYRLKLNASGTAIDSSSTPNLTDTIAYLHGDRIRDIAIAPSGDTLFFAIDKSGSTSGPTGGFSGASNSTRNPGYILRMVYLYSILPLPDYVPQRPVNNRADIKVFPNPASQVLYVHGKRGLHKPLMAQLVNMTGVIVRTHSSSNDDFSIPLAGISPGMYIFRLYNGYGVLMTTEKIIVR